MTRAISQIFSLELVCFQVVLFFNTETTLKLIPFFEGDDVKLEPISPLAQSPQPLSPMENGGSTMLAVKSEIQVYSILC